MLRASDARLRSCQRLHGAQGRLLRHPREKSGGSREMAAETTCFSVSVKDMNCLLPASGDKRATHQDPNWAWTDGLVQWECSAPRSFCSPTCGDKVHRKSVHDVRPES